MNHQRRTGQANTEYIVIIGLVAIGLIVAVGVVAMVVKWNFSRSADALAGKSATNSEQVAAEHQRVQSEIARANRDHSDISGFSEDGGGPDSSGGDDLLHGSGPSGVYHGGTPVREAEADMVSASSLQGGKGSTTTYTYDDSSNVETGAFGAYVSGGSRGKGSRSVGAKPRGTVFGIPWFVWVFLLLFLLVAFFLWATADQ